MIHEAVEDPFKTDQSSFLTVNETQLAPNITSRVSLTLNDLIYFFLDTVRQSVKVAIIVKQMDRDEDTF